jgi:hypothetical protein
VSDRVTAIRQFHETRSFGTPENLRRQQERAAVLYRSLELEEARGLALLTLDAFEPGKTGITDEILRCLACLRPGSLDGFHHALLDRGILYPPVVWHGAGADVASRIVGMLPGEVTNHLLLTLAWIGDEVVQDAFRRWRNEPPEWVTRLRLSPHQYAEEAGWELTEKGTRRDLFAYRCHPLAGPEGQAADAGIARVVTEHEGACRWCGRALTTLLDLDLTSPSLSPLIYDGRRLRIAACDVCSCYGTVFTAVGPDGESSWHEGNRQPAYLPRDAADWPRMPQGRLVLGKEPRHWLESADWLVPGVCFSQVGGHPTWVQDADYPRCPECGRAMQFVAQVSNEDIDENSEGIYYTFACRGCGVAAVNYQQS